jgi:hypothetical protein
MRTFAPRRGSPVNSAVAGAKQGAFLCTQIGTALAVAGGLTLSLLANPRRRRIGPSRSVPTIRPVRWRLKPSAPIR